MKSLIAILASVGLLLGFQPSYAFTKGLRIHIPEQALDNRERELKHEIDQLKNTQSHLPKGLRGSLNKKIDEKQAELNQLRAYRASHPQHQQQQHQPVP